MIEFEIDNKKVTSEPGKTVIEVADTIGIYIPRFCYHKKLSVAANCRMCLVEVEKSGKPLPACATPITGGMKVFTRSPKAIAAQRAVMEFLLINHPLDCPICDQGGECELQDLALGYGRDRSKYDQGKRSVHDKDLGPLVESCMTRCIQCTRCVRFGDEIAGLRELGAYNRGENLEIGTYVQRAMVSELSGNVIDICPVGALTSKPFRYTARAWEMVQHPSIAPHDCVGSNIYLHTRGEILEPIRHIMRVVPRANEAVNEVWLSDRDRFSYLALESPDRLLQPKIKQKGQWKTVDWSTALSFVVNHIQKIIKEEGTNQLGALTTPSATLEEFYLLQKLIRGLGSNNIDHRLQQLDFREQEHAPLYPQLGLPIKDIEKLEVIILIGSNVRQEQPMLNHRIRKAVLQGAKVLCINSIDYSFNYDVTHKIIASIESLPLQIAKVMKAITHQEDLPTVLVDKNARAFAQEIKKAKNIAIFLGLTALNHPEASLIQVLAHALANKLEAKVGYLTAGANSAGAWIAGAIPHRGAAGRAALRKSGLTAAQMLQKPLQSYVLLGLEPELDCAYAAKALQAMQEAKFVTAITTFSSPALENFAHALLPAAPFTEVEGTYINVEGMWQHFEPSGPSLGQSRAGWKILQMLGEAFQLKGFEYQNAHKISQELSIVLSQAPIITPPLELPKEIIKKEGVFRISEWSIYNVDGFVRRSSALQADTGDIVNIRINPAFAERLQLKSGDIVRIAQEQNSITLPILIDTAIPENNVLVPMGIKETAGFGTSYGEIELQKLE